MYQGSRKSKRGYTGSNRTVHLTFEISQFYRYEDGENK